MLERYNTSLKIACAAFALLLVFQLSQLFARKDPLANVGFGLESRLQPVRGDDVRPSLENSNHSPAEAGTPNPRGPSLGSPSPPPGERAGVRGPAVEKVAPEIQARVDRI